MVVVNFIPEVVQVAQARHRHIMRWAVSTALAAGALVFAVGLDWLDRVKAEKLRTESRQLLTDLERERSELRTVTTELGQLRLQIERARALQAKRAWSGLIAFVADCMPAGCWLTSIATDPARPEGGPIRADSRSTRVDAVKEGPVVIDAPHKLEIIGYAPEAAQPHDFVAALKEARVFSNVLLKRSQREPVLDGSYYRFELACEW